MLNEPQEQEHPEAAETLNSCISLLLQNKKKPPRTLQEKPDVFEIKNVLCLGLKQNTFTALAVLTNQRSYLIQDSCDCLNNIPGDAASLPPCVHSPRCRHTHGISNRISSPLSLSLSLSPAFTICRSPICPLCSIFPSNIPPLTPSPPLQPPPLLLLPLLQALLSAPLALVLSFGSLDIQSI